MTEATSLRTGGEILIEALKTHGADLAFCVPGESFLAALDAMHEAPGFDLTVCRQEGGAAMMADAYGKLTGRPGICFVTRGPGATNASAGVHIAFQDSTPMILFVGQVGREALDREAFQEVDFRRMFGQMAKWVAQIDSAERIPEYVSRAFHTATAGRMGPVVLALPEDMLRDRVAAPTVAAYRPVQPYPDPRDMERLAALLAAAERPLAILGGRGWDDEVCAGFQRFAEAFKLPVACAFRSQDLFDNAHPNYAGDVGLGINPEVARRVREADVLLAVGARLGEMTTGAYSLVESPEPRQKLVHVYPDPEELGRVFRPTLAINAGMKAFARALADLEAPTSPAWAGEAEAAHQAYLDWTAETPASAGSRGVHQGAVLCWLRDHLPPEAIVCNGAGNYTAWVHRFHRYRRFGSQLAPTSGSMGYGTPAAVGAKRLYPDRPVIAFAGDGCFMMNGQELATAVQYDLPIIVIVVNNGMYGTIRMHQERAYPGRVVGTELKNPNFAALAEAYGAFGARVEKTEDFPAAFDAAQASGKPALIELIVDPEAITPRQSLSEIRAQAMAKAGE